MLVHDASQKNNFSLLYFCSFSSLPWIGSFLPLLALLANSMFLFISNCILIQNMIFLSTSPHSVCQRWRGYSNATLLSYVLQLEFSSIFYFVIGGYKFLLEGHVPSIGTYSVHIVLKYIQWNKILFCYCFYILAVIESNVLKILVNFYYGWFVLGRWLCMEYKYMYTYWNNESTNFIILFLRNCGFIIGFTCK